MKYRYVTKKGPGYFILTFNDSGEQTNAFSNFDHSLQVWQSGMRWTGYCPELDITAFGLDKVTAYQNTEKMMNIWIATQIRLEKLEKSILDLGYVKEEVN